MATYIGSCPHLGSVQPKLGSIVRRIYGPGDAGDEVAHCQVHIAS